MLVLRIGMGHSWWARRCVVLGYGGLMERGRDGSGLLETDIPYVTLYKQKRSSCKPDRGHANQALFCCATVLPRCSP